MYLIGAMFSFLAVLMYIGEMEITKKLFEKIEVENHLVTKLLITMPILIALVFIEPKLLLAGLVPCIIYGLCGLIKILLLFSAVNKGDVLIADTTAKLTLIFVLIIDLSFGFITLDFFKYVAIAIFIYGFCLATDLIGKHQSIDWHSDNYKALLMGVVASIFRAGQAYILKYIVINSLASIVVIMLINNMVQFLVLYLHKRPNVLAPLKGNIKAYIFIGIFTALITVFRGYAISLSSATLNELITSSSVILIVLLETFFYKKIKTKLEYLGSALIAMSLIYIILY
ncbi:MAG: hypothetical protein N4A47_00540 [Clostridia bacterium]|jgi:drug/metabolite transporter (DMT)-like permease|nr:hypothetical protein [Clostridia bacterium]